MTRIAIIGGHGKVALLLSALLTGVVFRALAALPAGAQEKYPNRPVKFIVSFSAGGSNDRCVTLGPSPAQLAAAAISVAGSSHEPLGGAHVQAPQRLVPSE